MELHIEFTPGLPLRRQLERQLREAIRSGRFRELLRGQHERVA
jgi:hypothetical protein